MRHASIALTVLLLLAALAAYSIDGVNWRVRIVALKMTGELDSMPWNELFATLKPGSKLYIRGLIDGPNLYASIRNPYDSVEDVTAGERLFESQCSGCHGADGVGGSGPNIATDRLSGGDSDWAIFRILKDGIQGTAMAPANLADDERWRVTAYLRVLRQTGGAGAGEAASPAPKISVPYERILRAGEEPQNWLTYSGGYDGQRHTTLTAINKATLDRLGLRWVLQTDADDLIEASPIVVDGKMYLSLPGGTVLAVDARTGEQFWRWDSPQEDGLSLCCGTVNRGVAVLDDRVFATTLDNRVQSLDAATGKLLWESKVAEGKDRFTITVAPLAVKDLIIVGVSGAEYGIKGFLDAYDAESGELVWRFHTVPEPGQPGHDTWAGESWRTGGGPTWVTGSYDPQLNLLYWGVGNPSPDFDGSQREGDNLYTNSVIALDVDTGDLRWFFQFTPHDLHDFDSNQIPVLVDTIVDGQERALMLWANRNGFFYVLDRVTGDYLGSFPFAKQTWAVEIDARGRPVKEPTATPSPTGSLVWPGAFGATNWPPPSYNPVTGLFYVVRSDSPSVFFSSGEPSEPEPRKFWVGSSATAVRDVPARSVLAIDPLGLSIKWDRPLPGTDRRRRFSGILSTADLVFVTETESIFAIDAMSGEILWSARLGGRVGSPPVSYAIDGTQYLTVAAGPSVFTFAVDGSDK